MTIPTTSLNESSPAGSDQINQGDNRIREYKVQNREILEIDHVYPSSGQDATAGMHKKVSLIEQADLGTGATGKPILGAQTVSGKPELVFTDEDDNDIQLTTSGKINGQVLGAIPGWIIAYGGSSAPTGWLLCNGSAVSRTTYADLFAIVGTSFGVGDGSTTFNLPDLQDRFPLGKGTTFSTLGATGGATTKNLAHTHTFTTGAANTTTQLPSTPDENTIPDSAHVHTGTTDSGGSASQDVMNPYQVVNYIIKT